MTRNYKADIEELGEGYQEARDEEFNQQFRDFISDYIQVGTIHTEANSLLPTIAKDDVQGFIDSFAFTDVADWCASEYESRRDSYEDAKYEEMKEAKWEQEDEEK